MKSMCRVIQLAHIGARTRVSPNSVIRSHIFCFLRIGDSVKKYSSTMTTIYNMLFFDLVAGIRCATMRHTAGLL
jgi:hypothetical protein